MGKQLMKCIVMSGLLAIAIGQAQATTFELTLTGNVNDAQTGTQDWGGMHFDMWWLQLSSFDEIIVSQGDEIKVNIVFDPGQSLTVPASGLLTWLDISLRGVFQTGDTETDNGLISFHDSTTGLSTVAGEGSSTQTADSLQFAGLLFPPDNVAFTFDSVTANFFIKTLSAPATLDTAYLEYNIRRSAPVPEPATMLLFGTGIAGLTAVGRRKRS